MARKSSGLHRHYTADAVFILDSAHRPLVVTLLLIRMERRQRQYGLLSLVGAGMGARSGLAPPC